MAYLVGRRLTIRQTDGRHGARYAYIGTIVGAPRVGPGRVLFRPFAVIVSHRAAADGDSIEFYRRSLTRGL